ncbi:uncharacterized protein N7459_000290 [Penicillium hispanicum]|uniref:uncharacterized protein n=1 Tax=Penicillium hispanicum TaxID=1080232 RepID=UPI00253FC76C|nr:uncharacterized protein N7459_000290 [Penicillium hispanicum]KAJ5594082.1 hypothetical protein N7459_000290 [Penicillium hispanicum]
MQVAEILSDITSLQVCGHTEALALVNVHKTVPSSTTSTTTEGGKPATTAESEDKIASQLLKEEDSRRANDLVQLHYEFKSQHANGEVDDALRRARRDVEQVLWELT